MSHTIEIPVGRREAANQTLVALRDQEWVEVTVPVPAAVTPLEATQVAKRVCYHHLLVPGQLILGFSIIAEDMHGFTIRLKVSS